MYREVFERAAIGMAIVDRRGFWAVANARLCAMLGYSFEELRDLRVLDVLHPDDVAESVEMGRRALAGDVEDYRCDTRFLHAQGFVVWARLSVLAVRAGDGDLRHLVVQVEDTTAHHDTRVVLAEAEQRFSSAFRHAPIGMAIADLEGHWMEVNDALCEIFGYPRAELLRKSFREVTHPADLKSDLGQRRSVLDGEALHQSIVKRYLHADGRVVWANRSLSLVRGDDGEPLYFIAQVHDVTAQHLANERLTYMATHDALTGLANRTLGLEKLRAIQADAEAQDAHVGVIFIDLKGFKTINDQHGHQAGDDVLAVIGGRLAAVVHPSDTAARLGGDEFIVCLAGLGPSALDAQQQARAAAARITAAIEQPVEVLGHALSVQAALGVAISRGVSEAASTLVRRADQAMYESRQVKAQITLR